MKKLYITILILSVLIPNVSLATTAAPAGATSIYTGKKLNPSYTLLEPLPCIGGTGQDCTGQTIKKIDAQNYILYLFKLLIAVGVFLTIVMVTWGGFIYMTSEAIPAKIDAKKTIENALLGLLGVLGSYLLLVTIDPRLADVTKISVPQLNVTVSQGLINGLNQSQIVQVINQQTLDLSKDRQPLAAQKDNLQSKIDDIQNKLNTDSYGTQAEVDAAEVELQGYKNQINTVQTKLDLNNISLQMTDVNRKTLTLQDNTTTADRQTALTSLINKEKDVVNAIEKTNVGVQASGDTQLQAQYANASLVANTSLNINNTAIDILNKPSPTDAEYTTANTNIDKQAADAIAKTSDAQTIQNIKDQTTIIKGMLANDKNQRGGPVPIDYSMMMMN